MFGWVYKFGEKTMRNWLENNISVRQLHIENEFKKKHKKTLPQLALIG